MEAIGKHDPRLVAQRQRFDSYLDKAAAKEDSQEFEKLEREKKRMRPEETVPDVPNNTGASSSSGSKEAQDKRGEKRAPEDDGRVDLDEAKLEMARQAAEAGLAIARKRGERRSETTVTEREVRARIPESRGQKRISDEADSEMATKNTKIGQVHIPTAATRVRKNGST